MKPQSYIEDLARSYEITTSVRFCLSYDHFKLDIIAFKEDNILIENVTLSWTSLWRYIYAEKLCNVWSYHFYDMTE